MHAEVWGPFIKSEDWNRDAQILWTNSLEILPSRLKSFDFFYEIKNHRAIEFALQLGEKERLNHSILSLTDKSDCIGVNSETKELRPSHFSKFVSLHDSFFPETYLSGQQILKKINEYNKVFVFEEDSENIIGYIYVEVEPEVSNSIIHFFGINNKFRGKGLGEKLLRLGVNWIFKFDEIKEISLCVDMENSEAIKLYQKIGFQELHRCMNLSIKIE